MDPALRKRFALFLLACVPVRLLLVFVVATGVLSTTWLKWMAVPAAMVAGGFAAIFAGGLRRTGLETGGAPIWWNSLRPVHALLWGGVAYCAWTGRRALAWRILLADVCIGLISFLVHHGAAGDM